MIVQFFFNYKLNLISRYNKLFTPSIDNSILNEYTYLEELSTFMDFNDFLFMIIIGLLIRLFSGRIYLLLYLLSILFQMIILVKLLLSKVKPEYELSYLLKIVTILGTNLLLPFGWLLKNSLKQIIYSIPVRKPKNIFAGGGALSFYKEVHASKHPSLDRKDNLCTEQFFSHYDARKFSACEEIIKNAKPRLSKHIMDTELSVLRYVIAPRMAGDKKFELEYQEFLGNSYKHLLENTANMLNVQFVFSQDLYYNLNALDSSQSKIVSPLRKGLIVYSQQMHKKGEEHMDVAQGIGCNYANRKLIFNVGEQGTHTDFYASETSVPIVVSTKDIAPNYLYSEVIDFQGVSKNILGIDVTRSYLTTLEATTNTLVEKKVDPIIKLMKNNKLPQRDHQILIVMKNFHALEESSVSTEELQDKLNTIIVQQEIASQYSLTCKVIKDLF